MDGVIGEIRMFAGNFAPRDWAFCEGQLLAISDYQSLYSIVGTIYGGDGRTNFAVPDLRGRVPLGPGQGPGLSFYQLGQKGGLEQQILNVAQLPSHSHTIGDHTHTVGDHTHSAGDHTHDAGNHTHNIPDHQHALSDHQHVISDHQHTIPDHQHAVPDHQHSLRGRLFDPVTAEPTNNTFARANIYNAWDPNNAINFNPEVIAGGATNTGTDGGGGNTSTSGAGNTDAGGAGNTANDGGGAATGGGTGQTGTSSGDTGSATGGDTGPAVGGDTGATGSSAPFDNRSPFTAIHYIICLDGIYPDRS